jgi:hypothetical protein
MTANVDVLTKALYSTVLTDLGQSSQGNALMSADGVKYLAEYAALLNVDWNDGGLSGTPLGGTEGDKRLGTLGTKPTTIFGQVSLSGSNDLWNRGHELFRPP